MNMKSMKLVAWLLILVASAGFAQTAGDSVSKVMEASKNGDIDAMTALLKKEPNLAKAADPDDGATPLHYASVNGHADMVKLLLVAGANVNAARNNGFTPLIIAFQEGKTDAVKLLLAAAKPKEATLDLGGGVKLTLVWVPGGSLTMGNLASSEEVARRYGGQANWYADEYPAHAVALGGFWMGKYEVTNAQFRQFRSDHDIGIYKGERLDGDSQPVVMVSWEDATAFCAWLSGKSGKTIALPSEAQWEYACRAGKKTERPWGDDDASMGRYANVADRTFKAKFPENVTKFAEIWGIPAQQVTAVTDDGHAVAAPVGSYRPNAFGLYDMIGNVWEWCMDWHHDSYVGAPTNGSAWESPAGEYHVVRGGSWLTDPGHCRAASRDRGRLPRGRVGDGFRIVASRID